jgi:hypothetical protein
MTKASIAQVYDDVAAAYESAYSSRVAARRQAA